MSALQRLLNKVNRVTSCHRHNRPITKRDLDALSNAQLEYEESLRGPDNPDDVINVVNYIVTTQGFSGKVVTECETVEQVWKAIGNASIGALYHVTSPTSLPVGEFLAY